MGSAARPTSFIVSEEDEPHRQRNAAILKAHPEIKELMGYEWRTKYIVAATVALQVFMAWLTLNWSLPALLVAVYVVGATANHSLFLAVHELAHNLGALRPSTNKLIAIFGNMPVAIPYAITFKPYHMDHHRGQGHEDDTDIPTAIEGLLVTAKATCWLDHTVRKAIFMFFQIFAYALRPTLVKPHKIVYDRWLLLNWVVTFSFDAAIVAWLGPKGLLYFLLSSFFAGSIHPTAGHFISEHYVMEGVTETYSYYGPLNRLAYNVGYHNEHHDFPNIAWSKLPLVRKIAPEFYDNLPQCKSWPGTLFRYIVDDSISPFSRVKRQPKKD